MLDTLVSLLVVRRGRLIGDGVLDEEGIFGGELALVRLGVRA